MASKRTPRKVKRLAVKHAVEFDGHVYRIDGQKLDRFCQMRKKANRVS